MKFARVNSRHLTRCFFYPICLPRLVSSPASLAPFVAFLFICIERREETGGFLGFLFLICCIENACLWRTQSALQDLICQCREKCASATSMDDLCRAIEFMGGECRHKFRIIPGFSAEVSKEALFDAGSFRSERKTSHRCLW
jgi:hypothetical protein